MNTLTTLLALSVVAAVSITDAGGKHGADSVDTTTTATMTSAASPGAITITWRPLARACQGLSLQRQLRLCRPLK